ncbi:MAG: redox-regulated ATPase YchF [Kiritimatiellae bacterium]|jgi:GTP-binding protein YchF|nr:redox-regulated ATPase YchF [Kiritimatiellia bacterium]
MSLQIGILGLPNVGKSTIFNALTKTQNAEAANYPFCTIEPNKAVVAVPDHRIDELAKIVNPKRVQHATVDFVDIAGLVKGASRGEGLGNKFLANIREADALLHVVRCFSDENVVHVEGSINPIRDIEIIETELILADLQSLENRMQKIKKQARADKSAAAIVPFAEALVAHLSDGKPAATFEPIDNDAVARLFKECQFLSAKKVIYCSNVDEEAFIEESQHIKDVEKYAEERGCESVKISAHMEEELIGMEDDERDEFLASFGITQSGLDKIIKKGYATLGLCSYLTAGEKEVRAWTIHTGWKAPKAAGVIHTDFERGFIRAQVIKFNDFIENGGEQQCKAKGLISTEGKDYVVQDGDVIEFLFNV